MWKILRNSVTNFIKHHCPQMAAALAYYLVFSLPAFLLLSITIAGAVARVVTEDSEKALQQDLIGEIQQIAGAGSNDQIAAIVDHVAKIPPSLIGTILSVSMVMFSASGAMSQLQRSLNIIWESRRRNTSDRELRDRNFLKNRLFSMALVLVLGLLLLLSLMLSAALAWLGDQLHVFLPATKTWSAGLMAAPVVDWFVRIAAFSIMYRWLPEVRIPWKICLLGGLLTAVFFALGKTLLSIVLSHLDLGSAYGAAGSLAAMLAWFYYIAMVVLFAAELTRSTQNALDSKARS